MADDANTFHITHTNDQKTIFEFRMIRIIEEDSIFIPKYAFNVFEGYSVFSLIDTIFIFIPFKNHPILILHSFSIYILYI